MAIVKANYVKRGKGEKGRAKATIRYIQHRPGKDKERLTRTLFTTDGATERALAYRMVDEAEKGSVFFRFVISPDPHNEDQTHDLSLRDITHQTLQFLDEKFKKPVLWVGAIHDDHVAHRHVHVLACVPGRLNTKDFERLRAEATKACSEQRQERDLSRALRERQKFEREEAQWQWGI